MYEISVDTGIGLCVEALTNKRSVHQAIQSRGFPLIDIEGVRRYEMCILDWLTPLLANGFLVLVGDHNAK